MAQKKASSARARSGTPQSRNRRPAQDGRTPAKGTQPPSAKTATSEAAAKKPDAKKPDAKKQGSKKSAQKKQSPKQQPKRGPRPSFGDWVEGARLRTLPLAISPVVLGTAGAVQQVPDEFHWLRALGCLAVALLLQIGVNFANDYSDGVRGADAYRQGPPRLTASGTIDPKVVRNVAFVCFGLAAVAGIALTWRTGQWWLLAVGAAAILAAWFYTGGKRPYGYYGLGELFVFIFFGLVATAGTTYVQILDVPRNVWLLAAAAGFFACAVLMANNLRDIDQDRAAGKHTLAVILGGVGSRIAYGIFAVIPFGIAVFFHILYPATVFVYFAGLFIAPAIIIVAMATRPRDLVLALKLTSLGSLAYALLMALAIAMP